MNISRFVTFHSGPNSDLGTRLHLVEHIQLNVETLFGKVRSQTDHAVRPMGFPLGRFEVKWTDDGRRNECASGHNFRKRNIQGHVSFRKVKCLRPSDMVGLKCQKQFAREGCFHCNPSHFAGTIRATIETQSHSVRRTRGRDRLTDSRNIQAYSSNRSTD